MQLRVLFLALLVASPVFAGGANEFQCTQGQANSGNCKQIHVGKPMVDGVQPVLEHALLEICESPEFGYFNPYLCTQELIGSGSECNGGTVGSEVTRPSQTCSNGMVMSGRCKAEYEGLEVANWVRCKTLFGERIEGIFFRLRQEGRAALKARLAGPVGNEEL